MLTCIAMQGGDEEAAQFLKFAAGRPDIQGILKEIMGSQKGVDVIHVHAAGMWSQPQGQEQHDCNLC